MSCSDNTTYSLFDILPPSINLGDPLSSHFNRELLSIRVYEAAVLGHMLGVFARDIYELNVDPEQVAAMVICHGGSTKEPLAGEILDDMSDIHGALADAVVHYLSDMFFADTPCNI